MFFCYIEFSNKPWKFRLIADNHGRNAIVKGIQDSKLSEKLKVGMWLVKINSLFVENWQFTKIIQTLAQSDIPVCLSFRVCK